MFDRIERVVFFGAAIAGIAMLLFYIVDRNPHPVAAEIAPVAPDTQIVKPEFADLHDRLRSELQAAQCDIQSFDVVSVVHKAIDAADTSHGLDGYLMQGTILFDGQNIVVQGNGRGATAQPDAQDLLARNFILAIKERTQCD